MRILAFSPHCGIWQHALPESHMLKVLKDSNHEIHVLNCTGLFKKQCVTMHAHGITYHQPQQAKKKECVKCNGNRNLLSRSFGFTTHLLEDFLDESMILQTEIELKKVSVDNFIHYRLNDVPLGRYAFYHISLTYKKYDFDLTKDQFKEYLVELEHCLKTYFISEKCLAKLKPDLTVAYNAYYPVNKVFASVAKSRHCDFYHIHAGPNMAQRVNSLSIGQNHHFEILKQQKIAWEQLKLITTPMPVYDLVLNHYQELMQAKNVFVYSTSPVHSAESIQKMFGYLDTQKVLLLAMSSFDERFAAETIGALETTQNLLFPNQVEWIRSVVEFVKNRVDLFLIIRVHPREFPNKRESVTSEHAIVLKKILSNLPSNVKVDWPDEKVSLYSLLNVVDVCLNFSSSVGKESVFFGVPVLAYTHDSLTYPEDINAIAYSKVEYFQKLCFLAYAPFDLNQLILLFRWYAIEFYYSVVYLHNDNPYLERPPSFSKKVMNRVTHLLPFSLDMKRDCNREILPSSKSLILDIFENKHKTLLECFDTASNLTTEEEYEEIKRVWFMIIESNTDSIRQCARVDQLKKRFTFSLKAEAEEIEYAQADSLL